MQFNNEKIQEINHYLIMLKNNLKLLDNVFDAVKAVDFICLSTGEVEAEQKFYRSEIINKENEIKELQAACPHHKENVKQYKNSRYFEWTGNGHNCDYYTCTECGIEIKV